MSESRNGCDRGIDAYRGWFATVDVRLRKENCAEPCREMLEAEAIGHITGWNWRAEGA
jgi:hypothetical protein